MTEIKYQHIWHPSYNEVVSKNSKSLEQRVQLIQMICDLALHKTISV